MTFSVLLAAQLSSAAVFSEFLRPDNGIVSFTVDDDTISLYRVQFETSQSGGMTITVDNAESDEDYIQEYFLIDVSGLQDAPENVMVEFRINKYWIAINNVQENTLALNVYNGEWVVLDPELIGEDDDFLYFRTESPVLEALFAVTGEPLPLEFRTTSFCNGNDICEPEEGEDTENCGDCLSRVTADICVPFQVTCAGDYVMECGSSGKEYELTPCDFTCSDGECVAPDLLPAAGMFVTENSAYLALVAFLASIIAFLLFSLRRTRQALFRIEKLAATQDDLKSIAERKD